MATPTHRERILEALRLSSLPLDDDQLSARTKIHPRQAVNQTCRAMHREGLVRRYQGPDGKLVNELVRPSAADATPLQGERPAGRRTNIEAQLTVERANGHTAPPGSSAEQRAAERVMLDLLSAELGRSLEPARLTVPSGARVEIDGADDGRTVLVECWAHQGAPKAAQKHKVLSDALKLTWIASTIYPDRGSSSA